MDLAFHLSCRLIFHLQQHINPSELPCTSPPFTYDFLLPYTMSISVTYQTIRGLVHQESYHLQFLWTVQ